MIAGASIVIQLFNSNKLNTGGFIYKIDVADRFDFNSLSNIVF